MILLHVLKYLVFLLKVPSFFFFLNERGVGIASSNNHRKTVEKMNQL